MAGAGTLNQNFVVLDEKAIERFMDRFVEIRARERAERAAYDAELMAEVKKQTAAAETLAASLHLLAKIQAQEKGWAPPE